MAPDPRDAALFAPAELPRLREAVAHLAWLLTRGYAPDSSLKLVGDRFRLRARQRMAVGRSACGDEALADRTRRRVPLARLAGQELHVDGFNALTTIETALAGGLVLLGRDQCLRDLAGVHGQQRRSRFTAPALDATAALLAAAPPVTVHWWFDRPVSNSGRIRDRVLRHARDRGLDWTADLAADPDRELCATQAVAASADRRVLDGCRAWFNLAHEVVAAAVPDAWWVDLAAP